MERQSNKDMPLWIKHTPGTLILRGARVLRLKYGQKFRAHESEIPARFRHLFKLLEDPTGNTPSVKSKGEAPFVPSKEQYEVRHSGGGWYDVVSPAGQIMNANRLRSEDARQLKVELESE